MKGWNLFPSHLFWQVFPWLLMALIWNIRTTTTVLDKFIEMPQDVSNRSYINSEGVLIRARSHDIVDIV